MIAPKTTPWSGDFVDNRVRLSACGGFTLAYNLANLLRRLALPRSVEHWSPTMLREKLIETCLPGRIASDMGG